MADTEHRTLRLLSLMQGRRYWSGAELAGRLGVSVRTLRRDVDRLRELGYPVEAQPGVDGGYRLARGRRPAAARAGRRRGGRAHPGPAGRRAGAVAGMAESSVRALAKVSQVLPARLRRRVDALRAVTVPAAWPTAARRSTRRCSSARPGLPGHRAARASATPRPAASRADRLVEPHRLVPLGRRWYLVAYDPPGGDWRSFRLDRLAGAAATGAGSPPGRCRPRTLRRSSGPASTFRAPQAVEALVEAPADVVRDRMGRWARSRTREAAVAG